MVDRADGTDGATKVPAVRTATCPNCGTEKEWKRRPGLAGLVCAVCGYEFTGRERRPRPEPPPEPVETFAKPERRKGDRRQRDEPIAHEDRRKGQRRTVVAEPEATQAVAVVEDPTGEVAVVHVDEPYVSPWQGDFDRAEAERVAQLELEADAPHVHPEGEDDFGLIPQAEADAADEWEKAGEGWHGEERRAEQGRRASDHERSWREDGPLVESPKSRFEEWWLIATFVALLALCMLLVFSITMHRLIDASNDVDMRRLVVEKERLLVEQERLGELRAQTGVGG